MPDVSEIPETYICFHKITIACNGTENYHTFSRACGPLVIGIMKILYKLVNVVIHEYATFSYFILFEHAEELLNMIGHGVVMEGNKNMTGCFQTFGGHCISECIFCFEYLYNFIEIKIKNQNDTLTINYLKDVQRS